MQAGDLRRYYGLHYVTSSLEKKAEAAITKAKFDQDSTSVPAVSPKGTESSSKKTIESKQKRPIRSSAAYEIAASAASYIHSHAKDLLSSRTEPAKENGVDSCRRGTEPRGEDENPTRVHKSVVAAHAAASTMTAVVAAGEEEKQKAAKDLQSLHSAPCEWFVCDETSTYTRCFVIQVILSRPSKFMKTLILSSKWKTLIWQAVNGKIKSPYNIQISFLIQNE